MDRHQRTHEIKFSCRMTLDCELAENVIKLLFVYEKHIIVKAVYISQQNAIFKNYIIKPARIGNRI